jgi:hypothetical protein
MINFELLWENELAVSRDEVMAQMVVRNIGRTGLPLITRKEVIANLRIVRNADFDVNAYVQPDCEF